ncbi:MAG: hypothetical protein RR740_00695 [Pseudomonas sp.]
MNNPTITERRATLLETFSAAVASFDSADTLIAAMRSPELSYELSKECVRIARAASSEYFLTYRSRDVFVYLALTDADSLSYQAFTELSGLSGQRSYTSYCIRCYSLLGLASYDKQAKRFIFNKDNELFRSLYESAKYALEDETLYTAKDQENMRAVVNSGVVL